MGNHDEHDAEPLGQAQTLIDTGLEIDVPASKTSGPAVGDRFGQYHVLRTLGSGAMGTVVEAYDERLDRRVAIKLLHDRTGSRQETRLLREAQALARLSHPNVVQVYEVGEAAGRLFIAMELVNGQTLEAWQKQARPWREVAEVYVQAGHGLAAAHAEGLIHRDFKPTNGIIDERGRVKVLDFGLARESDGDPEEVAQTLSASNHGTVFELLGAEASQSNRALSQVLTRTGALLGTPAYMAPEQLRGRGATVFSDQFNFCVALYEALYRSRPFPNDSVGELISAVLGGQLQPPPSRSGVPGTIGSILRRGLSTAPADRWPSMNELIDRLTRVIERRTHRRVLGAGSLVLATAAGVVWGQGQADTEPPCRGAQERIERVYGQDESRAIGDALIATGVSYAAGTRERVLDSLDRYTENWAAEHTEACEATSVRQEQSSVVLDLRMLCLEHRRIALGRTVEQLMTPDATVVENAIAMVGALPAIDRCSDVTALLADVPPPEDPTVAAEVEAMRDQLAKVRVLLAAERIEEAQAVIDPVLVRSGTLDYGPLRAEAELEHGRSQDARGLYAEAEASFIAAYELAVELGADQLATRAATQLTKVVGHQLAQREVGRAWGVTAEALGRRIDPEGPFHAAALRSTAIVQIYRGKIDEAEQRFEHALRIWESQPGAPRLQLASALGDMGNLRLQQHRLDESLELYERARTLMSSLVGDDHPDMAMHHLNVGRALETKGQLDAARITYETAVDLYERSRGSDHPDMAIVLNNLAVVHDRQGKPDQALAMYERVLTIRERSLGPEHPYVGHTLANIGLALRSKGMLRDAQPYFERAVAILEKLDGRDVEQALYELSENELQLGRLEDARTHRERFLEQVRSHEDENSHSVAFAQFGLARVHWERGQRAEARALVERTIAQVDAGDPRSQSLLSDAKKWLEEHPADSATF